MTSNIIQGKVFGQARNVRTKYGERSVVDVVTADGSKKAIWKAADDRTIFRLADGERVTLTLDSKGNVQEIEGAYDRAQAQRAAQEISPSIEPPARPMGFALNLPMESERQLARQMMTAAKATATPVTALGQLFQECLTVADELVSEGDRVRVALALFDRLPQG
jgi:hypothetical protein